MAASDISGIEQSWDIALAVDFIFVILALLLCLFRLISELTNGDGRELADDLIIVASVRDLRETFLEYHIDLRR